MSQEHLKQYRIHFLLLRLRLSELQSLGISGCHRQAQLGGALVLPRRLPHPQTSLAVAPVLTSEWTQNDLECTRKAAQ